MCDIDSLNHWKTLFYVTHLTNSKHSWNTDCDVCYIRAPMTQTAAAAHLLTPLNYI